jgi:hypothetical protein
MTARRSSVIVNLRGNQMAGHHILRFKAERALLNRRFPTSEFTGYGGIVRLRKFPPNIEILANINDLSNHRILGRAVLHIPFGVTNCYERH